MASRFELRAGRWRRALFFAPLLLAVVVIIGAPITAGWRAVLVPLAGLMALAEWRRHLQPVQLAFAGDSVVITSEGGHCWQPAVPLHYFQAPGYLALRCRAGKRVRWLALYADELDAGAFARLNRLVRSGA